MSAENLSYIAGVVLSLVFSYLPGLKQKYEQLSGAHKRLVMLGVLAVTTAGLVLYQCRQGDCGTFDAWLLIFVQAVLANQAAYLVVPKK